VNEDLFVKKVPPVIKELIAREAAENHRSVNQETIALLEEALVRRVEVNHNRQRSAMAKLASYAAQVTAEPPITAPVPANPATQPASQQPLAHDGA
jgi:hypothetical protein